MISNMWLGTRKSGNAEKREDRSRLRIRHHEGYQLAEEEWTDAVNVNS